VRNADAARRCDTEPTQRSLPVERLVKRIPSPTVTAIAREKWRPLGGTTQWQEVDNATENLFRDDYCKLLRIGNIIWRISDRIVTPKC
jgi:hypothetical protein